MKPSFPESLHPDSRGFLLIHLLVYMAMLTVILALAYSAWWRCAANSRQLQQNAEDIAASLQAGERWREDVRLAQSAAPIPDGVKLAQAGDTVDYRFIGNAVWRHSEQSGRTVRLLSRVQSSSIKRETRRQIRAWRWEVELQVRKAPPFTRPLFTFEAVPPA